MDLDFDEKKPVLAISVAPLEDEEEQEVAQVGGTSGTMTNHTFRRSITTE